MDTQNTNAKIKQNDYEKIISDIKNILVAMDKTLLEIKKLKCEV